MGPKYRGGVNWDKKVLVCIKLHWSQNRTARNLSCILSHKMDPQPPSLSPPCVVKCNCYFVRRNSSLDSPQTGINSDKEIVRQSSGGGGAF